MTLEQYIKSMEVTLKHMREAYALYISTGELIKAGIMKEKIEMGENILSDLKKINL